MTSRSPSPSFSPSPMKRKSCARKCERACCSVVTYFPLAFVYGLTTWAAWVIAGLGLRSDTRNATNTTSSALGLILYILLNWSYSTAVFTDPGSPLSAVSAGYSHLPTHESSHRDATSFTVKSTGETRYCKKCQARKPDRAHHCSTCGRCVLKMDHHCPWLATCVGLRNYKAFLLFLTYTSVFCWVCFGTTTKWLWSEVFSDAQYTESFMPVNYVLLCVISGIIGLVLTGFTIWHLSLAYRGQTTIECLEKTRYLSPLRESIRGRQQYRDVNGVVEPGYGQQLAEIPGVTRPEEGESMLPNDDLEQSRGPQHKSYSERERERERERYEDYLDEQDSEKLPNAFDLGWKRNIRHLLGERVLLRGLPICNTTGDGWRWEPNPKWVEAREAIRRDREREWEESEARGSDGPHHHHHEPRNDQPERHYLLTPNGVADIPQSPAKAGNLLGRATGGYFDRENDDERPSSRMSMKTLRRRGSFSDSSEGAEDDDRYIVSDNEGNIPHKGGLLAGSGGPRKQD